MTRRALTAVTLLLAASMAVAAPMPQGSATPTATPTSTTAALASPSTNPSEDDVSWNSLPLGLKVFLIIFSIAACACLIFIVLGFGFVFESDNYPLWPLELVIMYTVGYPLLALIWVALKLWEGAKTGAAVTANVAGKASSVVAAGWTHTKAGVAAARASVGRGTTAARTWAAAGATAVADSLRRPLKAQDDLEMTAAEALVQKKLDEACAAIDTDDASTVTVAAPAYASSCGVPSYRSLGEESELTEEKASSGENAQPSRAATPTPEKDAQ
ncbi:hypothetical protein Q8F55_006167 [Vanrija albida]|uniref:MARVEL domain-containing protein n=1 Tax=Vanrija albida TaxID=181172 RepID=A0ABR3PWB3_9TREE